MVGGGSIDPPCPRWGMPPAQWSALSLTGIPPAPATSYWLIERGPVKVPAEINCRQASDVPKPSRWVTSCVATERKSFSPSSPEVDWPKYQGLSGFVSKVMAPPHGPN